MSGVNDLPVVRPIIYPKLVSLSRDVVIKFLNDWSEYLAVCESYDITPVKMRVCFPQSLLMTTCVMITTQAELSAPVTPLAKAFAQDDSNSPGTDSGTTSGTKATPSPKSPSADLIAPATVGDKVLTDYLRQTAKLSAQEDIEALMKKQLKFPAEGGFLTRIQTVLTQMIDISIKANFSDYLTKKPEQAVYHFLRVLEPKTFALGLQKSIEGENPHLLEDFYAFFFVSLCNNIILLLLILH